MGWLCGFVDAVFDSAQVPKTHRAAVRGHIYVMVIGDNTVRGQIMAISAVDKHAKMRAGDPLGGYAAPFLEAVPVGLQDGMAVMRGEDIGVGRLQSLMEDAD